jgi:hypothetical protein
VNYDYSRQYNVVASLHSFSAETLNSINKFAERAYDKISEGHLWAASPKEMSAAAKAGFGAILLLIITALLIRPLRRRILKRVRPVLYRNRPRIYAGSFYTEALELLAKHGMVRAPAQTPLEFAISLSGQPAGAALLALTHLYNRIRFGPPQSHSGNREAERLLRSLRSSLMQRKIPTA